MESQEFSPWRLVPLTSSAIPIDSPFKYEAHLYLDHIENGSLLYDAKVSDSERNESR